MAERSILLVCADPVLVRKYCAELDRTGWGFDTKVAVSAAEACRGVRHMNPVATLLDESVAVGADAKMSLESAASALAVAAPVIVVAAPQRQSQLAFLIRSGAVDFVPRGDNFVAVAAALIERRIRLDIQAQRLALSAAEPSEEFGEMLRHEVNNPLTGILGNAELLLAWRDRLPSAAVARIETIAALAVRLRETVCRLSYSCEIRGRDLEPRPGKRNRAARAQSSTDSVRSVAVTVSASLGPHDSVGK